MEPLGLLESVRCNWLVGSLGFSIDDVSFDLKGRDYQDYLSSSC